MIKHHVLSNGLRWVSEERPHSSSVALGFWVGIGSRHESTAQHGIAHFLEHLVFKGTAKRPESRDVAIAVERTGGVVDAESFRELTGYFVKLPDTSWRVGLDVLTDMLTLPLFKEEAIRSERQVVLEEIASCTDHPSDLAFDRLAQLLWPEHPLGRTGLGSRTTLSGMGREEILTFMEQGYFPGNMVISGVGHLKSSEVVQWLEDHFPSGPVRSKPKFEKVRIRQSEPSITWVKRPVEEAHLALGFRTAPRSHEDRYALALLDVLLGRGTCARLFQEVRDKRGLAYDVDTSIEAYQDTGAFLIYVATDTERAREATTVILTELEKLKQDLSAKDLSDAKSHYLGSGLLWLEEAERCSEWIGKATLLEEEVPSFKALEKKVRSVRPEDVLRVASTYFTPERACLSVVGPRDQRSSLRRLLEETW